MAISPGPLVRDDEHFVVVPGAGKVRQCLHVPDAFLPHLFVYLISYSATAENDVMIGPGGVGCEGLADQPVVVLVRERMDSI